MKGQDRTRRDSRTITRLEGEPDPGERPERDRPLLEPGATVDAYTVTRLVGRGGMGEVYLARDTDLGRKVALKVLRRKDLGDQAAIDRFLFEARTTARFNHPHIVTIYGVGTVGEHPYVALEYLEGQTLRERLRASPPVGREVVRIGLAVAEALREAHRHQILHRDLKPGNVMIPRDGRLRVVDFGLALRVDPGDVPSLAASHTGDVSETLLQSSRELFESAGTGMRGTPMYMSPEQWAERPATGASDVWALGLMLWELAAGRHPYAGSGLYQLCAHVIGGDPVPELPDTVEPRLRGLIARCVEKEPDRRPPITEVVTALEELVHGTSTQAVRRRGPFRGLLPCEERDAGLFFGRDAEIDAFLERLRVEPVLPVVGPSGAGKSSFVQAGVIPRLREGGSWIVLALRPGRRPFRALAARLAHGQSSRGSHRAASSLDTGLTTGSSGTTQARIEAAEAELRDELTAGPGRLALRLADLAREEGARVLLFVDQLEELVTLVPDDAARRAFLAAVCRAADDPEGPVRVVFTLRDDFLGRLAEGPEARAALGRVTVLRTPGRAALEEILTRSAAAADHEYDDPGLAPAMAAEVDGEPAALPLLQVAGQLLWDRRDRTARRLRRADYEEMGGVAGALAHHADGVLDALPPGQVPLARALLQRLVTPERTRRVVPRGELLEDQPPAADGVLDRLVEGRLLQSRRARRGGGDAEVELVHESLIRSWARLAGWLDASREERAFLEEVGNAARLWDQRGRHDPELWSGEPLRDAASRARRLENVPEVVRAFLAAGEALEATRRHRVRLLVGGVVAALLVFAAVMGWQRQVAVRERQRGDAQRAELLLEGARSALAEGHVPEARARVRTAMEIRDSVLGRALWWRLRQEPLLWTHDHGAVDPFGRGVPVAWRPGAGTVVAGGHELVELDARRGRTLRTLATGGGAPFTAVAVSPDGRLAAGWSTSGAIEVVDLETGTSVTTLDGGAPMLTGALAFGADGSTLAGIGTSAVGAQAASLRVWDLREETLVLEHPLPVADALALDPGGRLLVGLRDGRVQVRGLPAADVVLELQETDERIRHVAFGPGGGELVASDNQGRVFVWDAATGQRRHRLSAYERLPGRPGHAPFAFHRGERWLAACTAGRDRVQVWDVESGALLRTLAFPSEMITRLEFSSDGTLLLAGDATQIRAWDLRRGEGPGRATSHDGRVHDIAFDPAGRLLYSAGTDGRVMVWDVASGAAVHAIEAHDDTIAALAVHPDGTRLLTGCYDSSLGLWRLPGGRLEALRNDHDDGLWDVAFSPDGSRAASATWGAAIGLWEGRDGAPIGMLAGHEGRADHIAFSPDGRLLLSTGRGDGTLRLWDAATGAPRGVLGPFGEVPPLSAAFSSDGRRIVWMDASDDVHVLDRDTGRRRAVHLTHDDPLLLPFEATHDGIQALHRSGVLLPSRAGHPVLWDLDTGTARQVFRVGVGPSYQWALDPAGGRLAGGDGAAVRIYDVETGRPLHFASLLLPDELWLRAADGWLALADGGAATGGDAAWARAVGGASARPGHAASDGDTVCLIGDDGHVELWSRSADERRARTPVSEVARVRALPGACVLWERVPDGAGGVTDRVRWLGAGGDARTLLDGAGPPSLDGAGRTALVPAGRAVLRFDAGGEQLARHELQTSPAVATTLGERVVAVSDGGEVEIVGPDGEHRLLELAVRHNRIDYCIDAWPGPVGTLFVALSTGRISLWDLADGTELLQVDLHGRPVHHAARDGITYVATDVGDHAALDLSALEQDRCALLREVWDDAPAVWQAGALVDRPPPPDHPCAP